MDSNEELLSTSFGRMAVQFSRQFRVGLVPSNLSWAGFQRRSLGSGSGRWSVLLDVARPGTNA
jgi:hypothetical protein